MERDEWRRAAWRVTVARSLDACSLVFVDEMGTNTSLSPIYGWSKKGQRAYGSVPRNKCRNTTVLASMGVEGMGPSLAVEGSATARVFETYVERVLAPTLREGQVVVMDNLSAHKGERIRELIEERGCELIYLPSYSPDLNPVERVWLYLRERYLSHRLLADYEAVVDACCEAWNALVAETRRIQSLVAYPYLDQVGA